MDPSHSPGGGTKRRFTLLALLFAMSMAAMEATIVATVTPTIVGDIGGLAWFAWVGASYLLASTLTVPLFGRLSDSLGRRPVFLFGLGLFLLGSLASGLAPTMPILVAGRTVQGLGAGAMQTMSVTLIGDLFELRERGRVQGLMGSIWAVASVAGPFAGGVMLHVASWRWAFLINLPFGAVAAVLFLWAYREPSHHGRQAIFNWGDALLMIAGTSMLLIGAGDHQHLWLIPVALLLIAAFVWRQTRASQPLLPLRLLRRRKVAVACVCGLLQGGFMMGMLTYLPLFVQEVLGLSPQDAGYSVTPMLLAWPFAATLTARSIIRWGERPPILAGALVALAGTGLLVWGAAGGPWALRILQASSFLVGAGLGLSVTALLLAIQTRSEWRERGLVTSLSLFSRSFGGALVVAALGATLAHVAGMQVVGERVPGSPLVSDPAVLAKLGATLRLVFASLAGLGLLNLAAALFYPRRAPVAEAPHDAITSPLPTPALDDGALSPIALD